MVRSWQWWAESRSSEGLVGNERASFLLAGSVLAGAPVGAEGLAPATRTYQKYRLEWLLPREIWKMDRYECFCYLPIKSTGLSGCCRETEPVDFSGQWSTPGRKFGRLLATRTRPGTSCFRRTYFLDWTLDEKRARIFAKPVDRYVVDAET